MNQVKKRTKNQKDEQRHANAQAFNEGFQMGYKEGYNHALRELQNNNNAETDRLTPSIQDMSEL